MNIKPETYFGIRSTHLSVCLVAVAAALSGSTPAKGQTAAADALWKEIDNRAGRVEASAVAWRRDLHQHPELSNRETRTAALIAEHLRRLGIEVRTGVARTGVVGTLGSV